MRSVFRFALLFFLALVSQGCTKDVEVPRNRAAVVFDRAGIRKQVLREGVHPISVMSDVVSFDIAQKKTEFSFQVITKDANFCNLRFILKYQPLVDSLSSFFEKYNTDELGMIVELEIRSIIREHFVTYNRSEIERGKLQEIILKGLDNREGILRFIKIKEISSSEVAF